MLNERLFFFFTVKYDVPSCYENLVIYGDWYLDMHCRKLSSPIFLKIGNALFSNILNKQQNFAQEITIFLERKVK